MDLSTGFRNFGTALWENKATIFFTGITVLTVIFFLYLFYAAPARGLGPAQPIPFSHRVHAGAKAISCEFCHPFAGKSNFPGVPPVEKCLYCHNHIIANHPEIRKEHNYFNTNTPTPWVKVNYLPEHVFFKHVRHIKKEIACQECHGAVETMDRLPRNIFFMEFCITCHEQKKANMGCWLSCHN